MQAKNAGTYDQFLSTPSARRATNAALGHRQSHLISIHALREEGDMACTSVRLAAPIFLSTPSARRATLSSPRSYRPTRISIHALREEGDKNAYADYDSYEISIHALREEGDE